MKGMLAGMVAVGLALGLLAVTSAIYAGDGKQIETAELQTQDELDVAAWEAWRTDLKGTLEANEDYAVAKAAVKAYEGDDEEERANLEAARDEIYYAIARPVYEDHYGPWAGTDDEFIAFLAAENDQIAPAVIAKCAQEARTTCGIGKVLEITVTKDSCSFKCDTAQPIP